MRWFHLCTDEHGNWEDVSAESDWIKDEKEEYDSFDGIAAALVQAENLEEAMLKIDKMRDDYYANRR